MRVLHITTHLSGGAGKSAFRLHEAMLERGIESYLLCKHIDGFFTNNCAEINSEIGIKKQLLGKLGLKSKEKVNDEKLNGATNFYEYFSFCDSSFDVTEHVFYKNADVVNLHWVSHLVDLPSFLENNTKPLVWSLCDMNSFTGGCHYSNFCDKFIDELCVNCPQLEGTINQNSANENLIKKINALGNKNIDIITPSIWMHDNAKSSNLFKNSKHTIIPHASDEHIYKVYDRNFCREVFNVPKDKTVLFFSSDRISNKRKGFGLLLNAIKGLNNKNLHCLIIGKADQKVDLPEDSYTLTGFIHDEKLLALAYNAADAVVVPSIEENLGLIFIDSMICGIPTIGFNVGGIKDYLENGVNGYKSDEVTSNGLANAIQRFLDNKSELDREKIKSLAFELFSKESIIKKYKQLYNNL